MKRREKEGQKEGCKGGKNEKKKFPLPPKQGSREGLHSFVGTTIPPILHPCKTLNFIQRTCDGQLLIH